MAPLALVTGAAGLIGQYLLRSARRWASGWDVRGLSRAEVDLTDFPAVTSLLHSAKPDAIIHCAALSRTKDCELDPDRARRINVQATAHLAASARDMPFIFLSSGEVFDGRQGWYREADEARPINVYGQTKLEAERVVLANPRHTVLRIVLTAGTSLNGDRSFVEDMCRTARAGKDVMLYADEYRCPLPAGAIARAVWELLDHGRSGLFHLGGGERLSRWEIGEALLPWYPELSGRLIKGSARNHAGAPRPADLSLRCEKIQALLSFPLPGFRTWLASRSERGADLWDYPPP
ncbi:SDR family oxidoreductase [Nitrospira moscoviensis]|uniref:dTDP-4-dehydrorhamnose reductase n=1 Tax=Nitrospira moscoviensis TaxID=42253 RepID=A0A0K2GJS6_NITMO|nr:SDR family oxidoreductase [Nitrospira moscoviensis]ALA61208.1 putative dTDP-4-dehydrorhamnose reductase [Nitrospira moscoviensis]